MARIEQAVCFAPPPPLAPHSPPFPPHLSFSFLSPFPLSLSLFTPPPAPASLSLSHDFPNFLVQLRQKSWVLVKKLGSLILQVSYARSVPIHMKREVDMNPS